MCAGPNRAPGRKYCAGVERDADNGQVGVLHVLEPGQQRERRNSAKRGISGSSRVARRYADQDAIAIS